MKQGRDLKVGVERFPIRGGFTISRGAKHEAVVVVATIGDGVHQGRGECVPYARYGESVEGVAQAIEACAPAIAAGLDRAGLQALLPAGRGAQCARLRAVGPRGEDLRTKRGRACRSCAAPRRRDRLHHLARLA